MQYRNHIGIKGLTKGRIKGLTKGRTGDRTGIRPVTSFVVWIFVFLQVLLLCSCDRDQTADSEIAPVKLSGQTMGTTYHISLYTPSNVPETDMKPRSSVNDTMDSARDSAKDSLLSSEPIIAINEKGLTNKEKALENKDKDPTDEDKRNYKKLKQLIDERLVQINLVMSTYIGHSELSRLNAVLGDGCTPVSLPLFKLIDVSKKNWCSERSLFRCDCWTCG